MAAGLVAFADLLRSIPTLDSHLLSALLFLLVMVRCGPRWISPTKFSNHLVSLASGSSWLDHLVVASLIMFQDKFGTVGRMLHLTTVRLAAPLN